MTTRMTSMTTRLRLVAVLLALAAPAAGLAFVMSEASEGSAAYDAARLPRRVAGLEVVRDIVMDSETLEMVAPVSYAFRVYAPPASGEGGPSAMPAVVLYLAYYQGREGIGAHDPNVCYPAQGWEVVGRQAQRLELPNGEVMAATRLDARKGNERQEVLYWFQPARRWPSGELAEVFMRFVDGILGRPQYAFVRLSASSAPGVETTADLARMAAELAPHVRAELEGGE